jgi:hypothetical protein
MIYLTLTSTSIKFIQDDFIIINIFNSVPADPLTAELSWSLVPKREQFFSIDEGPGAMGIRLRRMELKDGVSINHLLYPDGNGPPSVPLIPGGKWREEGRG